ncbi:MAG: diacylglycerol/lipid kinase family protein [Armatimonadota bacterium]
MPARRVAVLGNPASGRGRGERLLTQAERALQALGAEVRLLRTERSGHAPELAEAAAREGVDAILVVGGDGTVRDAVQGLHQAAALSSIPLAILPGGTGNDLARSVETARTVEAAARAALGERERRLDVWSWDGTLFVNVAGVGLDAAVAAEVNRSFRAIGGTLAYIGAVLRVLPGFKPQQMKLTWPEGEWEGRVWLVAFGNAESYGGGMRIAPGAAPDDGCLEVVIVQDVPKWELLWQFPRLFTGGHVRHPRVLQLRVSEIEVHASPQPVTLDGELIGHTPARIRRLPEQLRLLLPPEE